MKEKVSGIFNDFYDRGRVVKMMNACQGDECYHF